MTTDATVVSAVQEIYRRIDEETAKWFLCGPDVSVMNQKCQACGNCCEFDRYGHKLYVTSPEVKYLAAKIAPEKLRTMKGGSCPYNLNGICSIHEYRFAGCRIFFCKADPEKQSQLSEWAVSRFKKICEDYELPYLYCDLKTALAPSL